MELKEKTLVKKTVLNGNLFNVRNDSVQLVNGDIVTRELIEHPGGACVAAFDENNNVYLVTQYRYGQQRSMIEFPAGKLAPGEDPRDCAKRELMEETGYVAGKLVFIGEFVPTGAYLQERIYMYYADDLTLVGQSLEPDEFLELSCISFDKLVEKVLIGEITDGKTIAMTLKIKALKERNLL